MLDKELLKLMKIHIDKNNVDILTEGLPREKNEVCRKVVGMDSTGLFGCRNWS